MIYDSARSAGADVMCLACPMCHNNLDMRQKEYAPGERAMGMVYLTQLVGWACGFSERELGLNKHFVDVALSSTGVPPVDQSAHSSTGGTPVLP